MNWCTAHFCKSDCPPHVLFLLFSPFQHRWLWVRYHVVLSITLSSAGAAPYFSRTDSEFSSGNHRYEEKVKAVFGGHLSKPKMYPSAHLWSSRQPPGFLSHPTINSPSYWKTYYAGSAPVLYESLQRSTDPRIARGRRSGPNRSVGVFSADCRYECAF